MTFSVTMATAAGGEPTSPAASTARAISTTATGEPVGQPPRLGLAVGALPVVE